MNAPFPKARRLDLYYVETRKHQQGVDAKQGRHSEQGPQGSRQELVARRALRAAGTWTLAHVLNGSFLSGCVVHRLLSLASVVQRLIILGSLLSDNCMRPLLLCGDPQGEIVGALAAVS